MNISRIELRLAGYKNTIAQGTIEFGGCLVVQFKLIKSEKGNFVKLGEAEQGKDGKWYSSAYITSESVRDQVNAEVVKKYNEVLKASMLEEEKQPA
jgi:DNA-binding cell septation regulator SpoVG